jgi:hypothetical protein
MGYEEVYKAARRERDAADMQAALDEFEDVEKFGSLVRLGLSGALKSKGGQKAMGMARAGKAKWGGMSTGKKLGVAAGTGAGLAGTGYTAGKLGRD